MSRETRLRRLSKTDKVALGSFIVAVLLLILCAWIGDAYGKDGVELKGEAPNGNILARITNGDNLFPTGTFIAVPREKLQIRYGNPLDEIILFIDSAGHPLCLIPKVGT